jgi:hypothetical protein
MIATVGLPVYNNKEIAFLAMEGLIRQQTTNEWELIVCEERNGNHNGNEFFEAYFDKLKEVGCTRLVYIPVDNGRLYLSCKWKVIAQHAKGEVFLMQGSDDYPDPRRVETACSAIKKGYHWFHVPKFYTYWNKTVYEYFDSRQEINLGIDKGTRTEYVLKADDKEVKRGVDGWVFSNVRKQVNEVKIYNTIYDEYKGMSTTGFNTISVNRDMMLFANMYPYNRTEKKLQDIIPIEVTNKIHDYESKANKDY